MRSTNKYPPRIYIQNSLTKYYQSNPAIYKEDNITWQVRFIPRMQGSLNIPKSFIHSVYWDNKGEKKL